jgi:hypothetical protein
MLASWRQAERAAHLFSIERCDLAGTISAAQKRAFSAPI